jgi:UDP-N-acetylmuramate dehydrogenase
VSRYFYTLIQMFTPQENQPLAPFTTFGIGGPARYFFTAIDETDIWEAFHWANDQNLPVFILGGGSNLLVRDAGFMGLVLHIALRGVSDLGEGLIEASAGEPWDTFVDYAVARDLSGIECLAGIPGLVGGTPVQNVGAYGQEVAETIDSVRAFDRNTGSFVNLTAADCNFRYRASLFNTDQPNRYIVASVRFRLHPGRAPYLHYADLQRRFAGNPHPTLAEVAATVRAIRQEKGMLLVPNDPDCRSAGSFFKNPVVPPDTLSQIAADLGIEGTAIPNWPAPDGKIKVPAAWLLEKASFTKGFGNGPAGISSRHTLALINRGGATFADIERLQNDIIATVRTKFGITLEREPVLVG